VRSGSCVHERLNDALAGRYVFSPKAEHTATMILTHGLGDTALGWTDAVQYFYGPQLPHFKFVLPVRARSTALFVPATRSHVSLQTAPNQQVTLNMGMVMPSWVSI